MSLENVLLLLLLLFVIMKRFTGQRSVHQEKKVGEQEVFTLHMNKDHAD